MDLSFRLKIAAEAAVRTGEMLRKINRNHLSVEEKALNDYVTEMDRRAEEMIISIIESHFPDDRFLGEEGGSKGEEDAGGRWIIDPIDGTNNFIHDIPHYAISIAYEEEGVLMGGVVYNPIVDELFVAGKGMGAFRNGQPIHVSTLKEPGKALTGTAFSHRDHHLTERYVNLIHQIILQTADVRRMGSAALDLCSVACGKTDAFLELGLHLYDIAAGVVILEEAGGKVSGWLNDEDFLSTGNVLASNGHLHPWYQEQVDIHFRPSDIL